MGPLGLSNGAFDSYVIYFSVIVLVLLLGFKVGIGASDDCKHCTMSWESFIFLGFLDLWRMWGWRIGFVFDLGVVVLCWVGDLWDYWGVCYLWSWLGVCYLWSLQGVAVGWLWCNGTTDSMSEVELDLFDKLVVEKVRDKMESIGKSDG
jgi:hypothetical protein